MSRTTENKELSFLNTELVDRFIERNEHRSGKFLDNIYTANDFVKDILTNAVSFHQRLLDMGKNPAANTVFLYIEKRLFTNTLYLMENKNFENCQLLQQISDVTPFMQQLLFCYCHQQYEGRIHKSENNDFSELNNIAIYDGKSYALSYEQVNVAPDCFDIFIKMERI